ncbi:MAG: DsbA family oxidoreductase [Caldilineaceae bacterium]|nr:DsbA family oxidoreductase [Caldilineaceae bacterium]
MSQSTHQPDLLPIHVDVWSDYVCPWCYLAASSLAKLVASHGVTVQWHSYELRPKGAPPISPEYKERILAGQPRLYAMAREQYGLELNQGPWGVDSRPALIGAKYAETQGVGPAYHDAVLRAYWLEAKSIDELDLLAAIAATVGLDPAAFRASLTDPALEQAVLDDVAWAHANGINGVPALVFQQKYLVSGAQPHPVLVQIVEQIRAEEQKASSG